MAEFKKVAAVADLPSGSMKSFLLKHDRILLCNTGERIYAVDDECSHDSAPISTGSLEGNEVVCPRHGARFDITDGSVKAPPAVVGIGTYKVKVEGDHIYVLMD